MSKKKDRLKPISFYPHNPDEVIEAFLKVDPQKVREKEKELEKKRKKRKGK